MNDHAKITAVALAAITLSACAMNQGRTSSTVEATSAAKSACLAAVNGNYGGDVKSIRVVDSELAMVNSEVIVDAVGVRGSSDTERWRCLASNDGSQVEGLTTIE